MKTVATATTTSKAKKREKHQQQQGQRRTQGALVEVAAREMSAKAAACASYGTPVGPLGAEGGSPGD